MRVGRRRDVALAAPASALTCSERRQRDELRLLSCDTYDRLHSLDSLEANRYGSESDRNL